MIWERLLDGLIAVGAMEMIAAAWLLSRRSWSDTASGKVFFGVLIAVAVMLSLLFINQLIHLPDWLWLLVALGIVTATTSCLRLVVRAGRDDFTH